MCRPHRDKQAVSAMPPSIAGSIAIHVVTPVLFSGDHARCVEQQQLLTPVLRGPECVRARVVLNSSR